MKVKIISSFGVNLGPGQVAAPGDTPDVGDFLGKCLIATGRAEAYQEPTPVPAPAKPAKA